MAKRAGDWYVSKRDMTLAGVKVNKGQLCRPSGQINDHKIFQENSPYTYRLTAGTRTYPCGTDGCTAEFDCEANLLSHRRKAHAPEWDEREKARLQRAQDRAAAEASGETIGGYPVVKERRGPHGDPVPYVELPIGR